MTKLYLGLLLQLLHGTEGSAGLDRGCISNITTPNMYYYISALCPIDPDLSMHIYSSY